MKLKIIKAFLTIVSALLISEVFFVVVHFFITNKYQRITDDLVSEYQLSQETTKLVNSFYDLIQYSNDKDRLQAFKDNRESLEKLLIKLDNNLANSDSWAVYLGTKNTTKAVINEVNKGVDSISIGNFSEVTARYLKATQTNNFVRENTGNLLLKELENVEKIQVDIAKTKFWSELFAIILFVAVALGSLLYSLSFLKKLINPLRRLAESSEKISSGDRNEKIDESLKAGDDELATLARSLDKIGLTLKRHDERKSKLKNIQLNETHDILADAPQPTEGSDENNETKTS